MTIMAKINNAVRIVSFFDENELYEKVEREVVSYFSDDDTRCYRLKQMEMLDKNHAILYFEEDLDKIMVRFMRDGEILRLADALDDINYFSFNELKLMNELGTVTICENEYEVEELRYEITSDGCRFATVFLF